MTTQFDATSGVLLDGVSILNGTIDVNGTANAVILDADGDTHISAPVDDQIDIAVNGADDFTFTSNQFNVLTGSHIAGPSTTVATFMPLAAQQNLSGAGAVNVTSCYTAYTSTGAAQALTLADGVVRGQLKVIMHVVDGGSGVLTPTNLAGGTTITFSTLGEMAELMFDGVDWVAIKLFNPTTPGTPPVLA